MSCRFLGRPERAGSRTEAPIGGRSFAVWIILLRSVCLLAVALCFLAPELRAQQTSTVIGTITFRNSRAAVNVLVSIAGRYRYTDVGGRYKIDGVPQGRQHMTIKSGKIILWQGDVNIAGSMPVVNQVLP